MEVHGVGWFDTSNRLRGNSSCTQINVCVCVIWGVSNLALIVNTGDMSVCGWVLTYIDVCSPTHIFLVYE